MDVIRAGRKGLGRRRAGPRDRRTFSRTARRVRSANYVERAGTLGVMRGGTRL